MGVSIKFGVAFQSMLEMPYFVYPMYLYNYVHICMCVCMYVCMY